MGGRLNFPVFDGGASAFSPRKGTFFGKRIETLGRGGNVHGCQRIHKRGFKPPTMLRASIILIISKLLFFPFSFIIYIVSHSADSFSLNLYLIILL